MAHKATEELAESIPRVFMKNHLNLIPDLLEATVQPETTNISNLIPSESHTSKFSRLSKNRLRMIIGLETILVTETDVRLPMFSDHDPRFRDGVVRMRIF
jgi:hypothetical protein